MQDKSVAAIARLLRPGGVFRFATDIADYVAWTLERVLRSPRFVWTAERADDWRMPWAGWVETRYEAKAETGGPDAELFHVLLDVNYLKAGQNRSCFSPREDYISPVQSIIGHLITADIRLVFESGPRPGPALFYYPRHGYRATSPASVSGRSEQHA